LSIVLSQEIKRFNALLDVVNNTLTDLREAIEGHAIMSTELEEVYWSFVKNTVIYSNNINNLLCLINLKTLKVPTLWQSRAYPSLKTLGSWIKDLILRLDFINVSCIF